MGDGFMELVNLYLFQFIPIPKDEFIYYDVISKLNCKVTDQVKLEELFFTGTLFDLLGLEAYDVRELARWTDHFDLRYHLSILWHSRSPRSKNTEFLYEPLLLSKQDIEYILEISKRALKEENVFRNAYEPDKHSSPILWHKTIKLFEDILKSTDFDYESIYYFLDH